MARAELSLLNSPLCCTQLSPAQLTNSPPSRIPRPQTWELASCLHSKPDSEHFTTHAATCPQTMAPLHSVLTAQLKQSCRDTSKFPHLLWRVKQILPVVQHTSWPPAPPGRRPRLLWPSGWVSGRQSRSTATRRPLHISSAGSVLSYHLTALSLPALFFLTLTSWPTGQFMLLFCL